MNWTRTSECGMRSGPWVIGKAITPDGPRYILTHDDRLRSWGVCRITATVGIYASAKEAMEAAQ